MAKISKSALIESIAGRTDSSKKATGEFLDAFIEEIHKQVLGEGNEVTLGHLGKFRAKHLKARQGRNPVTGGTITIPASTRLDFSPGAAAIVRE